MPFTVRILLLVLALAGVVALVLYSAMSSLSSSLSSSSVSGPGAMGGSPQYEEDRAAEIARKTLGLVDFNHLSGPELRARIEELLRIKQSVSVELRGLEGKRKEVQAQVSAFHRKIEELRVEATKEQLALERLRVTIP